MILNLRKRERETYMYIYIHAYLHTCINISFAHIGFDCPLLHHDKMLCHVTP
jgi:hypothetical protein